MLPHVHLQVPVAAAAANAVVAAPAAVSNPGTMNQPSAPAGAPGVIPTEATVAQAQPAPPQDSMLKPRPGPPPGVIQMPSHVAPVALNEQTLKLHQSYMNALQQHPSLFRKPKQPASTPQTSTTAPCSEPTAPNFGTSQGHGVGKPLQWRPSQPLHSGNATIGVSKYSSTTETQSNAATKAVVPLQNQDSLPVLVAGPGPAPAPPRLPPSSPIDPLKDLASSAPDFLSGFDRVALSLKPSPCDTEKLASLPQPQGDLHCSPTFTSRSFDDFHRFLGQDLVHLGSPARPPTSQDMDFTRPRAGSESAPPMFPIHAAEAPSAIVAKRPSAPVLSIGAPGGSNLDVPHGGDMQHSLLRSNSHEVNSMFSADSYCMFASAAVAASSQHAAYSAQPGVLLGMAHAVKNCDGQGSNANGHGILIKRNRADTFDMESTMNIVSAHVGGLHRQEQPTFDLTSAAEKTRTYHCSTVTLPTPRETMWERMYGMRNENYTAQIVSGSEPSTSSAATETESGNGSSSGNASPNGSENIEPSDHSGDSSSCCSDTMSDDDSDSQLLHYQTHKTKKARIGAGDVEEAIV
jgi:hypothetical protein